MRIARWQQRLENTQSVESGVCPQECSSILYFKASTEIRLSAYSFETWPSHDFKYRFSTAVQIKMHNIDSSLWSSGLRNGTNIVNCSRIIRHHSTGSLYQYSVDKLGSNLVLILDSWPTWPYPASYDFCLQSDYRLESRDWRISKLFFQLNRWEITSWPKILTEVQNSFCERARCVNDLKIRLNSKSQ